MVWELGDWARKANHSIDSFIRGAAEWSHCQTDATES
jgi:hypothetical protein